MFCLKVTISTTSESDEAPAPATIHVCSETGWSALQVALRHGLTLSSSFHQNEILMLPL